ncbi:MAG: Choline-sulfatase [Solirubrobacterales bacterium]|nr:Choline-sulfatase [Solirubrobacterales bacterium]
MSTRMDRRSFIKRAAAAGGGLVASQVLAPFAAAANSQRRPNILVIIVDQLRTPQWFPAQQTLDALLPNLARIRSRATSFESHYTASNMCVASRGGLLTGLYPHQTGCMLTNSGTSSTLSPKFPTWGTMLREQGYGTAWWGKWHLGPKPDKTPGGLEEYGFDGGTYPSPNGEPGQGSEKDPTIVDQFAGWLAAAGNGPWCTTVSLVNPHDINWWPRFTTADELLAPVDYRFTGGPPNVETAAQLRASKPRLQTALQETIAMANGPVPDEGGPLQEASWAQMLTLYLVYQQKVDAQIGRVLDALHSRPDVEANTIVIFTADHGEYAGSHGLRAKGGAVYEEAIHVPLYIFDPRGQLSSGVASTRSQLTSTVDLAALLLTIAHGSSSWRTDARYSQIAKRADIARIASNPSANGRPWIAHVTDETTIEELSYTYSFANQAPHHVAAVRTPTAKYAVYSAWKNGTIEVDPSDQDFELYDYSTGDGRRELTNLAGAGSKLQPELAQLLESKVIPHEVRAPLPSRLLAAQQEGLADYYARTAETVP